ncbi:MAG TPA: hypothetical protein VGJ70_07955 [Solirubrobacteraceae bacterium]
MIFPDRSGAQEARHAPAVDDLDQARPGDDDAIRALVTRLSRAHPSGGKVIERAAILASGADLAAVMGWIAAHAGQPETTASATPKRGLHASRIEPARPPRRYVLPAGALD